MKDVASVGFCHLLPSHTLWHCPGRSVWYGLLAIAILSHLGLAECIAAVQANGVYTTAKLILLSPGQLQEADPEYWAPQQTD